MTRLLIAVLAGLGAGLSAAPEPAPHAPATTAVVVDGTGPNAAARVAAARRLADRTGAALRIPHTLQEQVAVTTTLAARGYRRVYVSGLDGRYATVPLAGRARVLPLAPQGRPRG